MNDGGKDNINVDNNDTYSNVCITLYAHQLFKKNHGCNKRKIIIRLKIIINVYDNNDRKKKKKKTMKKKKEEEEERKKNLFIILML